MKKILAAVVTIAFVGAAAAQTAQFPASTATEKSAPGQMPPTTATEKSAPGQMPPTTATEKSAWFDTLEIVGENLKVVPERPVLKTADTSFWTAELKPVTDRLPSVVDAGALEIGIKTDVKFPVKPLQRLRLNRIADRRGQTGKKFSNKIVESHNIRRRQQSQAMASLFIFPFPSRGNYCPADDAHRRNGRSVSVTNDSSKTFQRTIDKRL